jgi:hypothetical protein
MNTAREDQIKAEIRAKFVQEMSMRIYCHMGADAGDSITQAEEFAVMLEKMGCASWQIWRNKGQNERRVSPDGR